MHKTFGSSVLCVALGLAAFAGGAQAQPGVTVDPGFYVDADLGDDEPATCTNASLNTPNSCGWSQKGVKQRVTKDLASFGYNFDQVARVGFAVSLNQDYGARKSGTGAGREAAVGLFNTQIDVNKLLGGTSGRVVPFVGAGVGVAKANATRASVAAGGVEGSPNLAWGVSAGVGAALTKKISLDFNYDYANYGRTSAMAGRDGGASLSGAGSGADEQVAYHTVGAAVRIKF